MSTVVAKYISVQMSDEPERQIWLVGVLSQPRPEMGVACHRTAYNGISQLIRSTSVDCYPLSPRHHSPRPVLQRLG